MGQLTATSSCWKELEVVYVENINTHQHRQEIEQKQNGSFQNLMQHSKNFPNEMICKGSHKKSWQNLGLNPKYEGHLRGPNF